MSWDTKKKLVFGMIALTLLSFLLNAGLILPYLFPSLPLPKVDPSILLLTVSGGLGVLFVYLIITMILVAVFPTPYPERRQP